MKAIIHTKLILEDGILWDGALTYDQWQNPGSRPGGFRNDPRRERRSWMPGRPLHGPWPY